MSRDRRRTKRGGFTSRFRKRIRRLKRHRWRSGALRSSSSRSEAAIQPEIFRQKLQAKTMSGCAAQAVDEPVAIFHRVVGVRRYAYGTSPDADENLFPRQRLGQFLRDRLLPSRSEEHTSELQSLTN